MGELHLSSSPLWDPTGQSSFYPGHINCGAKGKRLMVLLSRVIRYHFAHISLARSSPMAKHNFDGNREGEFFIPLRLVGLTC